MSRTELWKAEHAEVDAGLPLDLSAPLWWGRAQAAAADADAERGQRAEAERGSEQLRADGERRARVFRNAVAAAVARVQAELEAERDGLAGRCGRRVWAGCQQGVVRVLPGGRPLSAIMWSKCSVSAASRITWSTNQT